MLYFIVIFWIDFQIQQFVPLVFIRVEDPYSLYSDPDPAFPIVLNPEIFLIVLDIFFIVNSLQQKKIRS